MSELQTISTPFFIGQEMWLAVHSPRQVTVPCPVCNGDRAVTVILGSGERVGVECDACGIGFNIARGVIEEWIYSPAAERFVIAGLESMHAERWNVRSETGASAVFSDLFETEAGALAESAKRCERQHEENMRRRQHQRGNVKKQAWTVRYHRERIADCERQIAWHASKINKAAK